MHHAIASALYIVWTILDVSLVHSSGQSMVRRSLVQWAGFGFLDPTRHMIANL